MTDQAFKQSASAPIVTAKNVIAGIKPEQLDEDIEALKDRFNNLCAAICDYEFNSDPTKMHQACGLK